jgi:hypothetical protein
MKSTTFGKIIITVKGIMLLLLDFFSGLLAQILFIR